jgi:hypothetical protein
MKYLKILGLAAFAATALMAFVGAGTATAETTLCKTTTEPCPSTGNYPAGTVIKGTSTNSKWVTAFMTESCSNSSFEGKLEQATTPKGKITSFTWSGCTFPATTRTLGELQVHHDPTPETGKHNGTVTILGTVVKIESSFGTCYYFGEVKEGLTLKAGGSPVLVANAKVKLVNNATHPSSSFCSAEGTWTADYSITPAPMYVTTGV